MVLMERYGWMRVSGRGKGRGSVVEVGSDGKYVRSEGGVG